MASTVAQMTKEELSQLIDGIFEKKFREFFGDPDEGLEIRETIRERLLRQKEAVASGERGESFDYVVRQLGNE